MLAFLQAIPVLGQAITLITKVYDGAVYSGKWIAWKIGMTKLQNKKEKINEANSPSQWTDIFNNNK